MRREASGYTCLATTGLTCSAFPAADAGKSLALNGWVWRAGKVGIFSGNTMQYMMALQAGNYYNTVVGAHSPAIYLQNMSFNSSSEVSGNGLYVNSS